MLVVLGHANRGIISAPSIETAASQRLLDNVLYVFHMPVFFLLAGLFLQRSIERVSTDEFLRQKARALLWPACLWTWILAGMQVAAGGASNAQVSWASFPFAPLPPYSLYWFLWALFGAQALALAFHHRLRLARPVPLIMACVVSWLISALIHEGPPAVRWLWKVFYFWPFLLVGMRIGPAGPGRVPLLVACAALAIVEISAPVTIDHSVLAPLAGMVGAVAFCRICMELWFRLANTRFASVASELGRLSMPIYLVHCIFTAGGRPVLARLGVDSAWLYLAGCTVLGLIGSLVTHRLAQLGGIERSLGFRR